jgi:hypothetical protein
MPERVEEFLRELFVSSNILLLFRFEILFKIKEHFKKFIALIVREEQLNKVNPRSEEFIKKLQNAKREMNDQEQLDESDAAMISNQSLKDLSNQIFKLSEEKINKVEELSGKPVKHDQSPAVEEANEGDLENIASDQMKRLNKQFNLLIKQARDIKTVKMETLSDSRFKAVNENFNANVSAYVDACCHSNMVGIYI